MKKSWWVLTLVILIVATASIFIYGKNKPKEKLPSHVDYNIHIRPILSDRCFKCHGPDGNARKANLRLDTPEGAMAALKDNPKAHAIVPGDPELSEVYLRISTTDTSQVMPPVKSNLKLNQDEIQLIKKWISQGAVYKPHWAFIPPKQPAVPDVEKDDGQKM